MIFYLRMEFLQTQQIFTCWSYCILHLAIIYFMINQRSTREWTGTGSGHNLAPGSIFLQQLYVVILMNNVPVELSSPSLQIRQDNELLTSS